MFPPLFDRNALQLKPLEERQHDLDIKVIQPLGSASTISDQPVFRKLAPKILEARRLNRSIILMMGGHVIRSGAQRYLIDLMERGFLSGLAMNGAGIIHDFEFALIGKTTESVAHYIRKGQFGLWKETGILNDIINRAFRENPECGMGEAVGRAILDSSYPYKETSLLAQACRLGIPVTVHVGMGYDIIHEHPNCDGAATGALSYNDFLRFAALVKELEKGVIMNFGSAVMAPEIFLKALAMARNLAHQKGEVVRHFCSLVCDLYDLPSEVSEEPPKSDTGYYFRPWKTMLVRTVADGGEGYYVKGTHSETIPALWASINKAETHVGD